MFQFPGFALISLCIQPISTWSCRLLIPQGINNQHSGGFPHSEIFGSKPIPGSPKLIAGYRVLHRLLLPRHPPNALIALDLTRKKKDPHPCGVRPVPRRDRPTSFQISMQLFPPSSIEEDLVSVLDLDNAAVGSSQNHRTPTRVRPTTLIISLNDVNAAAFPLPASDWTGKQNLLSDQVGEVMVEPDGVEPTTSCLQSRRSTS